MRLSRPALLGTGVAVIVLAGAGAFVARRAANAAEPRAGAGVTAADARLLVHAADACPQLTPARLAGQIMVASGFGTQPVPAMRAGGAAGPAALTPEQWRTYAPWPGANPGDRTAAVTGLARGMCRLIGQTRAVAIQEDPWTVALAAHRVGMDQIVAAGRIPDAARSYVDDVKRYAAWYALQPTFGAAAPTPPAPSTAAAVPVPPAYVKMVAAAGRTCTGMPPARIAAQLMVMSGFDPDRLGPAGEQGIAQYLPPVWSATVPKAGSRTPWDPAVAIPALGHTMCKLLKQSGGQYAAALAAFTRGGADRSEAVTKAEAEYAKDTRLQTAKPGGPPAKAAPATAKPKKPKPSPKTSKKGATAAPDEPERDQPPVKAAGVKADAYGPYFVLNHSTGLCVDVPGFGAGQNGGPVTQYPCAESSEDNQEWRFVPRRTDDDGYQLYWIRNTDDDLCLDPPGETTVASGTELNEVVCLDDDNQYFRLEPRFTAGGFQYYWLRNTTTGMCLDVPGIGTGGPDVKLGLVPCLADDDHEWALVQKSEW